MMNLKWRTVGRSLVATICAFFAGCGGGSGEWRILLDPHETLLRADLPPPDTGSQALTSAEWPRRRLPGRFDLDAFRLHERMEPPGAPALPAPQFPSTVVELSLDPVARTLEGRATIAVTAADAEISSLAFYLSASAIDAVEAQDPAATFTFQNEILTVTPAQPIPAGGAWSVSVRWHDRDVERELDFTLEGGGIVLANYLGNPSTFFTYGYHFWPRPRQTNNLGRVEFRLRYPEAQRLYFSGRKLSEASNGDGTASAAYEVEHVLWFGVSLALSSYQVVDIDCGDVTLHLAGMPGASIDGFPIVPASYAAGMKKLCEDFSARFGPPAFSEIAFAGVDERFINGFSAPGLILVPNYTFDDDGTGSFSERDFFLGHELSHQWWGNDVFIQQNRNIWLIEGMADYVTMQALGALYDAQAIRNLWRWEVRPLLDWWAAGGTDHPLVPPAPIDMEPRIFYVKGAWVLKMLEGVIGESAMRSLLRTIRAGHPFTAITTEEFMTVAQTEAGSDLGWFFDQWAFGTGWLELDETHVVENGRATVTVTQKKSFASEPARYFRTPLLLRAEKGEAATEKSFTLENAAQEFLLDLP
ncbi:MAG: M1 family metallopeptidase [Myxococcales bacterium]|nr:M1 family metallopeptidase [Myxococcales bacterium]